MAAGSPNSRAQGRHRPRVDVGQDACDACTYRRRERRTLHLPVLRGRLRAADFHKDGKLISIEGDPESPISQGNLCPKGAASYQLLTHSRRETKMKYRAPRAKGWTEISLDRAMDMVAERVWESRERTFVREVDGSAVNHTTAICHLGGATLDNEENYLIKKLFTGGLGMVCVFNQARI